MASARPAAAPLLSAIFIDQQATHHAHAVARLQAGQQWGDGTGLKKTIGIQKQQKRRRRSLHPNIARRCKAHIGRVADDADL
jgi:hypothetical protein